MAGDGVARDGRGGIELYRKGCGLKSAAACYLLGRHLVEGRAVERDDQAGQEALAKACELGLKRACSPVHR